MPFRPRRKQPEFADLKGILSQSKQTDNALYQTVQAIIERLIQFQQVTLEEIAALTDPKNPLSNVASKYATYHTKNDETFILPNSWQLLAGPGVIFDDSVSNQRTIKIYYDAPLTDGNVTDTGFIFGLGECIIVQVPNA
jgi:hypothetical protein